ncbi:MAG: ATP-binding protein [Gelidibacter sp.]|nr:ATP-binding protein [Gelidibacter sp.]
MNTIENQLRQLRLQGMLSTWTAMRETRQHYQLDFEQGLEMLLQAEDQDRTNRRFERLQKSAKFRYQATIEELSLDTSRGINTSQITDLTTGNYLKKGESVLITGSTGCGKSFLASALGHQACSQGNKVLYFNTQKLLMQTKMSRIDGSFLKLFEKLGKANLLILDDFGLSHLDKQQQMDLMEIIEDRHNVSSTIIASQLPVGSWYEVIGEATIADAILDRLVHTSHRIELKGESLRKKL